MPDKFILSPDILEPSQTQTTNGTGTNTKDTSTSKAIELWVIVTASGGTTPNLNIVLETSIDDTNFTEQTRISAIAATGTFSTVLNRADQALGTKIRISWEISGGGGETFTWITRLGRMES